MQLIQQVLIIVFKFLEHRRSAEEFNLERTQSFMYLTLDLFKVELELEGKSGTIKRCVNACSMNKELYDIAFTNGFV